MEKKNNIYFWRIICTILIIILHFKGQYGYSTGWYICVEFFFFVSGYLLIAKYNSEKIWGGGYLRYRVRTLGPQYIFSFIATFIVCSLVNKVSLKDGIINLFGSWYEMLGLQMLGFQHSYYNVPAWYISALLIDGYFISYLYSRYKDLYLNVLAPIIVIFVYSYFFNVLGHIDGWGNPSHWYITDALLRGAAGISVGALCYNCSGAFYKKISQLPTLILNIIEVFGFLFVFVISYYMKNRYDFILISILAFSILLAFMPKKGFAFMNSKVVLKCSKLCLPIYLNHEIFRAYIFPEIFPEYNIKIMCIYMICVILFSYVNVLLLTKLASLSTKTRIDT